MSRIRRTPGVLCALGCGVVGATCFRSDDLDTWPKRPVLPGCLLEVGVVFCVSLCRFWVWWRA